MSKPLSLIYCLKNNNRVSDIEVEHQHENIIPLNQARDLQLKDILFTVQW